MSQVQTETPAVLEPLTYGSVFGIFSQGFEARLDIGPGFVKPLAPFTGTWGNRLVIQRLDGPSTGPVYMNHMVGLFANNPALGPGLNTRLDIGSACVLQEQSIANATISSQLTISSWSPEHSPGQIVNYGDEVHIISYQMGTPHQYELDISTLEMKIAQSASHVSWATQLFFGPPVIPINQAMLDQYKALSPNDPQVQALTLASVLQNTNGYDLNWGNVAPNDESERKAARASFTPCQINWGFVIADCLCLAFGAVGLRKTINAQTAGAIASAATTVLSQLEIWIHAISATGTSAFSKASAVFQILSTIYNGGLLGAVITAFIDSLSWYQATLLGIQGVATLVAAFATDGLALAAQMMLMVVSFAVLGLDCYTLIENCFGVSLTALQKEQKKKLELHYH